MPDLKLQINFKLEGRDAAAFLSYKDSQFLSANAEVARQLVLQRLAQIQHENASARRKPLVRSGRRKSSDDIMLSDFKSENVA